MARCLFLRFGVLLPLLSRWDALLDLDSAVLVPSSQHKKHELSFRVTVLLGAEPRDLPGLLTALLSGARARRMVSTYSFYFCRNRYCVMVSVLMEHSALPAAFSLAGRGSGEALRPGSGARALRAAPRAS